MNDLASLYGRVHYYLGVCTISNANVLADKATGARAKKESGKTPDSSAPYALKLPNKESLSALANVAAGNGKSFDSVEELRAYLEADD